MKAQEELRKSQERLTLAQEEIKLSQELSRQTQKSLRNARVSFKEYEKDSEHKIKVKTRQRNMWMLLAGGFLVWGIAK